MLSDIMKRFLLPLVLLIVTASTLFSSSFDQGESAKAVTFQKMIESFYPRLEGSAGGKKTFAYIESELASAHIPYTAQNFSLLENAHSFSRILSVVVRGRSPDTLIIAVSVNNAPGTPGKDAGAVNIAAAIALARHYSGDEPPLTLRFLFLGAESPFEPPATSGVRSVAPTPQNSYPLGSRLFLQDYFPESPVAVFYLDFQHAGGGIRILPGGGNVVAPLWLVRGTMDAAEQAAVPFAIAQRRILAFRLGRAERDTPIAPYLAQDIPAIELANEQGAATEAASDASTQRVWYGDFSRFFDTFLRAHADGFSSAWDRHYLLAQIGTRYVFLSERASLLMLLVTVVLTLVYTIFRRHRLRRYIRTVLRNSWNLPLLLLVTFLFLFGATLLVEAFLAGTNFPTLWMHAPLLFFGLKPALTLFLSTLAFRIIRRLPISRNGSFYSAAAIAFLLVDVLIAALINLAFIVYFLFAFLASFLFSVSRYRWLKIVLMFVAPLLLLKAAWDVLTIPELHLVQALLLSPVNGNLLLAFVTLPFLLMVMRVDFLIRHPVRGRASFASLLAMILTGFIAVIIGIRLLTFQPYSTENPQPVTAHESVNANNNTSVLSLDSPAPLGNLRFRFDGRTYTLKKAGRHFTVDVPGQTNFLSIDRSSRRFLDREQMRLVVSAKGSDKTPLRLYRVSVSLSSLRPIIVYDLNYPFTYSADNRRVTVHIGVNPPDPLNIDYTIPSGDTPIESIDASFLNLPSQCIPLSPGYRFQESTDVHTIVDVKSGQSK